MKALNFIIENWDVILLIVAAVASVVTAVFKRNKSVVMRMLYGLVTEAEQMLEGSGTGSLKLAAVVDAIYPKLPGIVKVFVSDATIVRWVEEALKAAKEAWAKNPALLTAYKEPAAEPTEAAQNAKSDQTDKQ